MCPRSTRRRVIFKLKLFLFNLRFSLVFISIQNFFKHYIFFKFIYTSIKNEKKRNIYKKTFIYINFLILQRI